MFCSVTGYGGTTGSDEAGQGLSKRAKKDVRPFRISFNSDVSASLPWSFEPLQKEVVVMPGSSMLAFFRAKNNSDEAIVGVSSYNVQPSKAGAYFVKIQW
jgi:cytochrome c oxidase assembly protein subunit 11